MADHPIKERPEEAEDGSVPWAKIYASVLLFTVMVLVALWLFSRAFTP